MKAASDPGCRGFSLLELLLALAIASLLAALATGSYSAVTARVHRQEVRLALWRLAAAHENHHLRHGRYAASIDSRGQVDTPPEVLPAHGPPTRPGTTLRPTNDHDTSSCWRAVPPPPSTSVSRLCTARKAPVAPTMPTHNHR